MGLFTSPKLSEEKVERLNSLLPANLQKKVWKEKEFILYEHQEGLHVYLNLRTHIENSIGKEVQVLEKQILVLQELKANLLAPFIQIFNTEPFNCKPIGMVDIGATHKFSASSTGDRFAGGLIGYAIENAADNVYAKGSMQEEAVNSTKLNLLRKAKALFPDCNNLFKYEIDFRELGSSGNVFIYMRGTACMGDNNILIAEESKFMVSEEQKSLTKLKAELKVKKGELLFAEKQLSEIPKNLDELLEF